jgi:hypothetical protein
MKFYEFKQNNTGGSFDVDEQLCNHLIIEAKDENEAIQKAESMGVYFNGCDEGMDCPCCGDRWYTPSELDSPYQYGSFEKEEAETVAEKYAGTIVPSRYKRKGEERFDVLLSIEAYAQYMANDYGWTSPDARIFYSNGEVKEIFSSRVEKRRS